MSGGIARALGEIARHWAADRLLVSTARNVGSESFDSACPARVDRGAGGAGALRTLPGSARWAWRAARLADSFAPEFLWAGNLKPAGHVARWLGARRRIRYGLIVYGLDLTLALEQARRSPLKRRVLRRLLADAAGTVAISHWTAERFRDLAAALGLSVADQRIRVVPLGVDCARFRPGQSADRFRAELGPEPRQWLLTVARLEAHKGIDTGLEVLARLRREGVDVGYLIAGEGPARDALHRLAGRLGVLPAVRWLGWVPEADLPALYGVADLYLGLSRSEGANAEGFGLSLLEAQASGLPVLAGASGGTSDAVLDGVSGLLLPPTGIEAIADAAGAMLREPARAAAMGRAGRARAEREFGWDRVVRELEAAAAGFIAAPAPRAGR
jgi:phosphatidylinositol alpha-1,6-mannosyltransferase